MTDEIKLVVIYLKSGQTIRVRCTKCAVKYNVMGAVEKFDITTTGTEQLLFLDLDQIACVTYTLDKKIEEPVKIPEIEKGMPQPRPQKDSIPNGWPTGYPRKEPYTLDGPVPDSRYMGDSTSRTTLPWTAGQEVEFWMSGNTGRSTFPETTSKAQYEPTDWADSTGSAASGWHLGE